MKKNKLFHCLIVKLLKNISMKKYSNTQQWSNRTIEQSNSGFTFVEIIVYMGILSFLLLILTQILTSVLDVRSESEAASYVQQDGRYILARLTYDINHAQSVEMPSILGQQTNSLQIKINGEGNTYTLAGSDLTITNNSGTNNLNGFGSKISNLSFRRLGNINSPPTIKISFTITSTTIRESGPEVKNLETTVGLR